MSLAVVADRERIVTTAAFQRAKADGLVSIGASNRASGPYRASQRGRLLQLAAEGQLEVPIGATYPLADAPIALQALMRRHPFGKLALVA